MSYWEHAARMRELEEQPLTVLLDRIGEEASMLERRFMTRAHLRSNGMLVGFDHEVTEAEVEGRSIIGLGFTAKVFIAWQNRKYLLFEDCAVESAIGREGPTTQHHTLLALIGDSLGTYDTVAGRTWAAPLDPEQRSSSGRLDAPHPFLKRVQAMLELYSGVEASEALRLLEIELEELLAHHEPLSAIEREKLVRIIEVIE